MKKLLLLVLAVILTVTSFAGCSMLDSEGNTIIIAWYIQRRRETEAQHNTRNNQQTPTAFAG